MREDKEEKKIDELIDNIVIGEGIDKEKSIRKG